MTTVADVAIPPALRAWTATDVAAAARALEASGRAVLHLEVGEPDFPTPPHVVAAAIAALQAGHTRYAPAAGLPALREAAAETLVRRGVTTTASQVLVGPGARLLLHCATLALLQPGDEAAVPDPGYGAYAAGVRQAGARPVAYPVRGDGTLDLDALAASIGPRTRVLFLNAPHNPTGGMLDADTLAALAAIVERHDLTVVADEIYAHLAHRCAHRSIATVPGLAERTIVVDGFSKRFAMTGWRLGYAAVPAALVARVTRLLADTATCTPPFVQLAGVAALTGPQTEAAAYGREVRARRDCLVHALDGVPGVRVAAPDGGLYAFPCVRALLHRTGGDDVALARTLLEEDGIACVPGSAFGSRGAGHLRVALAAPAEQLERVAAALRSVAERALCA